MREMAPKVMGPNQAYTWYHTQRRPLELSCLKGGIRLENGLSSLHTTYKITDIIFQDGIPYLLYATHLLRLSFNIVNGYWSITVLLIYLFSLLHLYSRYLPWALPPNFKAEDIQPEESGHEEHVQTHTCWKSINQFLS